MIMVSRTLKNSILKFYSYFFKKDANGDKDWIEPGKKSADGIDTDGLRQKIRAAGQGNKQDGQQDIECLSFHHAAAGAVPIDEEINSQQDVAPKVGQEQRIQRARVNPVVKTNLGRRTGHDA